MPLLAQNRLYSVNDAVNKDAYSDDLDDQGTFSDVTTTSGYTANTNNNYRYDAIGNLVYDKHEKKIPLEDVQLLAGHRFPSSTERYKRVDTAQQRALINRFHPLR